ncbi:hypothetical protein C2845_PM07G40210 [Panicum miliaceum]|uniref:Uncharacterized protein n=1 Tax=Panicum miliaceum TaxID=4540 RepID=A0A3L6SHL7_PANMI|nr:hypothetical protein C2845_PM07G40210 [Panicum miliaceum]
MAADRPLLVLHDKEEGHLVYDLLLLLDGEEETTTLACFPRPVARFPSQWCLSFAVSGGSIVGAEYDWNDTYFHDTVMKVGGYDFWERHASPWSLRDSEGRLVRWWPMFRSYASRFLGGRHRDRPAMLPLPDGTVVRMDTVLFDGIYTFETLRPLPGGGGWHATPLPNPPGTFSLDTKHGRTWRKEGTWLLPFEGRAFYVPKLDSVIGLTAGTRLLCACDVDNLQVVRHVWTDTYPRPWEERIISDGGHPPSEPSKPRDMPSLAYLGKGRICICRPMSTMEPSDYGPIVTYNAASLLVVELKRSSLPPNGNGDLHLARRGKMSYMWPPQGRESPYMGFIQPATC